ncbi:MAG: polysaccharide biosynthesis protein [Clostridia bacterium]|nr:polysaccharide biosynthesis protein [Clostridia bacterium]
MSEPKKQNYLHGAAILAAGVVIMKILGAIYKIPLQNILGDTGYGYFNGAYTIYNVLLTISTAGLPVALSRMISEANTLGHSMQARRIFRVATGTLFVLGAVLSALMFFFPTEMAIIMISKAESAQCVFALSPAVLLVCLTSAFRGYIQGHGNMKPTMVGQVLEVLIKVIVGLALAWYFTQVGKSLPIRSAGAIFGVTVGAFFALIYMWGNYLKHYKNKSADAMSDPRSRTGLPDSIGRTLSAFLKIGIPITLGASVMSLISLIDTKLIQSQLPNVAGIGKELADTLYGSYSAMQTLYNLPAALITPMVISVVPAISAAMARRNHAEAGEIAESSMRISAVIALPMGIGLTVLAYPIVHVLYKDTHEIGPSILALLGIASFFVCMSLVTNAILQAHGNEKLPILSMLVGGAVKIAANLLLVGNPSINILGAPIGTICCYIVICFMNCIFISRSLEFRPNYGKVFLRPLLSSVVMGGAAWAVYGLFAKALSGGGDLSRLRMAAAMFAAIVIAVIVYLILVVGTRAVTAEDMKLLPKGDKLAKLLKIR